MKTAASTPLPPDQAKKQAFWPQGWWRLMGIRIGIIPLPIYVIAGALIAALVYLNKVPNEISLVIVMFAFLQEFLRVLLRAEPHHPLDSRAVVPTAVEDHDFSRSRQLGQIALYVHLAFLALGRRGQCKHAKSRASIGKVLLIP